MYMNEWLDREVFVGDTCHLDVVDRHGNALTIKLKGKVEPYFRDQAADKK